MELHYKKVESRISALVHANFILTIIDNGSILNNIHTSINFCGKTKSADQ